MDDSLVNIFSVVIAVLLGIITGLIAMQLARASSSSWPAAFCYGAGVFAGTVVLALVIKDHL